VFEIENHGMSQKYLAAWTFAYNYLNTRLRQCTFEWSHPAFPLYSWRRNYPHPPCLDHLSFRCGNQLFFVRLDVEFESVPGSMAGLIRITKGNNGFACLFPIAEKEGQFVATTGEWGLIDAISKEKIDPISKITSENQTLTEWELYKFALDYTLSALSKRSIKVFGVIDDPDIYPSIWIIGNDGRPRWILVGHKSTDDLPDNWQEVVNCHSECKGYYVNIKFTNGYDLSLWDTDTSRPITRLESASLSAFGLQEMLDDLEISINQIPAKQITESNRGNSCTKKGIQPQDGDKLPIPNRRYRPSQLFLNLPQDGKCTEFISRLKQSVNIQFKTLQIKLHAFLLSHSKTSDFQIDFNRYFPLIGNEIPGYLNSAINSAISHLQHKGEGQQQLFTMMSWSYWTPYIEHISFQLGNNVFFVHLETAEAPFTSLSKIDRWRILEVSKAHNAIPCILPMTQDETGKYHPRFPGWGLFDARSGSIIEPETMAEIDLIELTAGELHIRCVRYAIESLEKSGKKILKYSTDPAIRPSIWFQDGDGIFWVDILGKPYPGFYYPASGLLDAINADILLNEKNTEYIKGGFFALISIANEYQKEDTDPLPIYRSSRFTPFLKTISADEVNKNYQQLQKLDQDAEPLIYDSGPLTEEDALRAYAAMMNTLDSSYFEVLIADDFVYRSQRILKPLSSKLEFTDYIRPKLQVVKNAKVSAVSEMGTVVSYGKWRHCVLVSNGSKDDMMVALAETDNGMIKRIDLCDYPDPHSVIRSGEYPKS